MQRKGQSTLEYAYLVAIVAVAIIATMVYIKRGFQGNLRGQAEQGGAGSYSPGNTTSGNTENKGLESKIVSTSTSTVTYGTIHRYSEDVIKLKAEAKALQDEVNKIAEKLRTLVKYSPEWEALMTKLGDKQEELNEKQKKLNVAMRTWQLIPKTADKTTSTSENVETGTEKDTRQINEESGAFSGDKWTK